MRRAGSGRHCDACDKRVFDLSRATERYANALLLLTNGSPICARISAAEDGVARFAPERQRPPRPVTLLAALALGGAACSPSAVDQAPAAPASPVATAEPRPIGTWAAHVEPPFVDTDQDGLADAVDNCPQQPGPVSQNGCVMFTGLMVSTEIRILEQVVFERDSASISGASRPIVETIAKVLQENKDIAGVEIRGHVQGGEKKGLGLRRAQAVKDALIKAGVEARRIAVSDRADTMPLAPHYAQDGFKNRRVDFEILSSCPTPDDNAPKSSI